MEEAMEEAVEEAIEEAIEEAKEEANQGGGEGEGGGGEKHSPMQSRRKWIVVQKRQPIPDRLLQGQGLLEAAPSDSPWSPRA